MIKSNTGRTTALRPHQILAGKDGCEVKKNIKSYLPRLSTAFKVTLYTASIALSALTIYYLIKYDEITPAAAALFLLAGVSLALSVIYATEDLKILIKNIKTSDTLSRIRSNSRAERIIKDYSYRTAATSLFSFVLNIIYASFNAVVGIISSSSWYVSLAFYYTLLSLMRIFSVRSTLKHNNTKDSILHELRNYRLSGVLFILMSSVLVGIVAMTLSPEHIKTYPGMMIYAVATYTFIKTGYAVLNASKAARTHSPSTMTLRNVCLIDSLVSLVSLGTAMTAEFGSDAELSSLLNRAVGGLVCLIVFFIGVTSVINAGKGLKRLKSETADSQAGRLDISPHGGV